MIIPHAFLFANTEFTIVDVVHEYVTFVGTFFIVGAASFYFLLLRPSFARNADAMRVAGRSAARIGVGGALLRVLSIAMSVSTAMTEKQLSLVAAIATLVIALRGLITADVGDLVNPIHVFAASMWIGTLFVMVVAGITTVLSGAFATSDRGPACATIVNRFSTLALWSAGVLVLTGVTTAYLHLRKFSALWTSVYGQTLLVKLCLVAVVFWLGGYNNWRMKPTLGTEDAARRLNRSATYEIAVAAVVLIVTAVLVKLPTPGEHVTR